MRAVRTPPLHRVRAEAAKVAVSATAEIAAAVAVIATARADHVATAKHRSLFANAPEDAEGKQKPGAIAPGRPKPRGTQGTKVKIRSIFRAFAISWLSLFAGTIGIGRFGVTALSAQDQAPNRRDVTIVARDFHFVPNRIEVVQDELVRVTLTSEGRTYSLAIDAYRIIKRAGAGQTIVFDFRADQAGTFTFYCNLTSVSQCKDMKGTLVVAPK